MVALVDRREHGGTEWSTFLLAQVGGTIQRPLLHPRRPRPIGRNHLRLDQTRVGDERHLPHLEQFTKNPKNQGHPSLTLSGEKGLKALSRTD